MTIEIKCDMTAEETKDHQIVIYSDGSSSGNSTGCGGWAFVVMCDGTKIYENSGRNDVTTNNVMELTGAIKGLEYVKTIVQPKIQ